MFKEIAKKTTQESSLIWNKSRYMTFLSNANRDELLKSQIPFYYAVKAFPLLLLKLASQIKNEDARYLIVENIWEEHGQGEKNKFHTHTFKSHLSSLGFKSELYKNPFITEWIDSLFNTESLSSLFHQLAAIEYMYAVISESITNKLSSIDLLRDQDHYLKHSEIDWSHGEDILISMNKCGINFNKDEFKEAQLIFINLFSKMSVPTQKETLNIKQTIPVSFYHTRESSNVIDEAITLLDNNIAMDVLTVCSGGESVIHYASHENVSTVTAFDMNNSQLNTCLDKISLGNNCCHTGSGRFEYLFLLVREYFIDHKNSQTILNYNNNSEVLDYVIDMVFDNEILNILFSDEATKYSKLSFKDHFKSVYKKMTLDVLDRDINNKNSNNVILGTPFTNNINNDTLKETPINYLNQSANSILSKKEMFHLIDLSNIGDWMPYNDFEKLVSKAINKLHNNGILIVRRLLGDYSLANLNFSNITSLYDDTGFYSETVVIKNEI